MDRAVPWVGGVVTWFDQRTGIEMIDRSDCLALLAGERVGRLGIIEGGHPLVLPVNFALDGEAIVLRTGEGSKLDAARGHPACFEIDGFDRDHRTGWSVVVRGDLREVTAYDQPTLDRTSLLADPWIPHRGHVLRLVGDTITGRRVGLSRHP